MQSEEYLAGRKYAFVAIVTAVPCQQNFFVSYLVFTMSVNQILFSEHFLYLNYLQ